MSILVLGTVALDTVKTPAGERSEILGGSAAHFAMAARFFTKVNLAANIGRDFPTRHLEILREQGINLDSVKRCHGKTFRWWGQYKGDMNSATTLKTELGVLTEPCPDIAAHQRKIKYLFLANVDPDMQRHLLSQMRSLKLVGLDSMNYWIKHKRKPLLNLLKKVDIYFANDTEARQLSGEHNLIRAAKILRSFGPRIVVIKKGEHGVFLCDRDFVCLFSAYPLSKIIDPTGAGDTFAGGFMGFLSKAGKFNEQNLRKAVAFGTVIASFNVEGFGLDRTIRLTFKEIQQRLKHLRRIVYF